MKRNLRADVGRARTFAAKWRAENGPDIVDPSDDELYECFIYCARPPSRESYPLVRQVLRHWND